MSRFALNNSTHAFSLQSVVREEPLRTVEGKIIEDMIHLTAMGTGPQVEKDTEKFPLSKCFTLLLGYFTITPRRQPKDQTTPHRSTAYPS